MQLSLESIYNKNEGKNMTNDITRNKNKNDKKKHRFIKESIVGEGAFGIVYKARYSDNPSLGPVALKIVSTAPQARDRVRSDPVKEIEYLNLCASPHVIPLLESFETPEEGIYTLVFPFVPTTLYNVLQAGPLHEGQAKGITRQLLEALSVLHKKRVIHRDIKPNNIALTFEGTVLLIDFGRACEIENDRPLTPQVQMRKYRSPEILFGGEYDESSDIWAVGALVFEMLTGFPLVDGASDIELMCSFSETFGGLRDVWKDIDKCSDWGKVEVECSTPPCFSKLLLRFPSCVKDFISLALTINPKERPSAEMLLKHRWFSSGVPEMLIF